MECECLLLQREIEKGGVIYYFAAVSLNIIDYLTVIIIIA